MKKNYFFFSFVFLFVFFLGSISLHAQYQKVDLVTGLANATNFKFAPDGRIFIVDRYGELLIYQPDTQVTVSAGTVSVYHEIEDGLLGLEFDPNFATNNYIYLHFSPLASEVNRVSRFSMVGDVLDLTSETIMLEWPTNRITGTSHSGGDMDFDSQGNLYIATGDNTQHSAYAPLNENSIGLSAEKSSSNTNDFRGKILRITPQPNASYTIPAGNLFPGGTGGLPEIYVMGARNPYRIFVDKTNTDWLFWGEVGPDANTPSTQGPEGLDEINLTKTAQNAGWPYFSGVDNDPYLNSYANPDFYYNPLGPVNISTWNTGGATNLPPAEPAWLEKFHKCYLAGPRYYYDSALTDDQRLPIELDGVFFYYDFNTSKIWTITMDANGNILTDDRFDAASFPTTADGFIDMKIGPDGKMYILAYGAGCCPDNVGTGRLVQVNYTGITTNSPPVVVLTVDVTNGALPLTVNFSGAGTTDPNGDTPLSYSWDFTSDGTPDATTQDASFTYTTAGTFNAQLKVDDGQGGIGVKNVTIYAGNTKADFDFIYPPDGGLIGWGDEISLNMEVSDAEDGSTTNGSIDCNDVALVPSLGHINHFHDDLTATACPQDIILGYEGHDIYGEMDIYYVFGASYTDQGGLTSRDQFQLHPKRKEAEFFDAQTGVTIIPNNDPLEGGFEAIRVNNNSHIVFEGRNLLNITAVSYRVAAEVAGGTIEMRLGSTTGTVLATTTVPATGGLSTWVNVESTFTDPGGKNDIYFVVKNATFDLNYVEFIGAGVSADTTPPTVLNVSSASPMEVVVEFSEIVDQATAEQIANYSIDNGISITSAVLQTNGRTVILTMPMSSMLMSGITYGLTVSNVTNLAGISLVTVTKTFSMFESMLINSGGQQVATGNGTFVADVFSSGGAVFTNSIPIAGTSDDELYQTERYGSFSYAIPVPSNGPYDIRLHFAELFFGLPGGGSSGGVGSRVFDVTIEGNPVLTNFDILSEVDPATALQKELDDIEITDGVVNIQFTSVVQSPKISAIEILSSDTFSSTDASITITSPSSGWDVNQPFDVAFSIENWVVLQGDTHVHYYIDDVMVGPYYSYDPITIDNLSLGNHTIKIELFLADHTGTGVFDEVTVNVTGQISCNTTPFPDQWGLKQLETSSLPYRSVYTFADYDFDGDGFKDIVTGGWWYKNPGSIAGNWVRSDIGGTFKNVAFVHDFDGDGDMDLLGTTGEYEGAQLVWAQNNGSGSFTVFTNIPAGDTTYSEPFLAGIAGGVYSVGGPYQMAINWNGAEQTGSPVQMLTVPNDPTTGTWSLVAIAGTVSSGEDIQAGDIDQDNDLDLFQGVNWLRNNGDGTWTTFNTGITYATTVDRAQLADFDRDGDLDAVVGQLSLGSSAPANNEFAWFAAPADPTQPWVKNVLATDIEGSLSVFATDIDFDGDKDIVVGEWRGAHRLIVFDNDLCDSGSFIKRVIHNGDAIQEHHDGARVTDIDNDGDLDIISNGWVDNFPRIYENEAVAAGNDAPVVDAGGDQSVLPGSATLNGSANDPDGGAIASYVWTQQSGPNTATLSGDTTADLTASGLVIGTYVFRLTATDDENDTAFDEATITVSDQTPAIRINSGGPTFNFGGLAWSADQHFNGGATLTNAISIANTDNDQLYQTERYSTGTSLVYEIPVTNGDHNVNLHFAEIYYGVPGAGSGGGAGSRVFNVDIENGEGALTNYDIVVAAGGSATAIVENFTDVTVADGSLTITLTAVTDFPKISGIEVIVPGSATAPDVFAGDDRTVTLPTNSLTLDGSATDPDGGAIASYMWTQVSGPNTATFNDVAISDPTVSDMVEGTYVFRLTATDEENETGFDDVSITIASEPGSLLINSGGPGFMFNGADWIADQYFVGGTPFENVIDIANTDNDQLYQTERFNSGTTLVYEIPVAAGSYNIDLHFAEIYFGVPGDGSTGGAGSRVFNINIENGQEQIDNYDIVVAAGGSATAVIESYSNITVNDGMLTITLTSVTNFPKISGIGVFETRPPEANAGPDQTIAMTENSVVLNGTGTDPDGGDIASYQWTQESGPNNATLTTADSADMTAGDLVEGVYVFRLTVTDDEGETGFDDVSITVGSGGNNQPPVAILGASPITGGAPLLVTFVGGNSTDDVAVVSYLWNFGDGTSSTDADPEKIYTIPGSYVVELTVTDGGGLTHTATVTITVSNDPEGRMSIILETNPPNPAGTAKIQIINKPADVNVMNITIHDVGGRYLNGYLAEEIAADGGFDLPVSTLRNGLYFVRVVLNQGESVLIKLMVRN